MKALACALGLLMALGPAPAAAQRRGVKVPRGIVRQLARDENVREFFEARPELAGDPAKFLAAESADLDGDGGPEFIVRGINQICGANNCHHWIYRKAGGGYRLLLYAGFVQQIEPQRGATKGFRDLIASMHGSASDSDLTLYKFDGKRYRRAACFFRTYRYRDGSGRFRDRRRPLVTRTKCETER